MIQLYYTRIPDRLEHEIFNSFLKQLPSGMQTRILRFRKWEDRQRAIMGKLLLIEGLKSFGHDSILLSKMKFTRFQKPYFDKDIHFNISHSGEYSVCVISETNKVGVDIEEIRDIPLADFDEQFSKKELEEIYNSENPLKLFYSFWTQKEAFLKTIGSGLNIPLNKVSIRENKIIWENEVWFLKEIKINPGYICHLSTDSILPVIKMHEIIF